MKPLGRFRRGALILLAALFAASASAERIELPEGLRAVEAEAFAGDASIREVEIPRSVEAIGARAFAGCANLGWIAIPGEVAALGEDCLDGCAEDLLIRTDANSAALAYARARQIDYQADTHYRALLIGQTYAAHPTFRLDGPQNDAAALAACLEEYPGTNYSVETREDLTAAGLLQAIREAFGDAGPEDVSLFYYAGHGMDSPDDPELQGALVGSDIENCVSASMLRAALDEIPGRKIVIIDACFSGGMIAQAQTIGAAEPEMAGAQDFTDSFIAAFSRKSRGNLAAEDYFVLVAAAQDEESYEDLRYGKQRGLFTTFLLEGCGYRFEGKREADRAADANENGVLTLRELYLYAWRKLIPEGQHAQVYPDECGWFGLLRSS